MTKTFRNRHQYIWQLLLLSVVLTFCAASWAKTNVIAGIRVWPAPENTRVVFDLSTQPDFSYFTLSSPERLVIDFQHSQNAVALAQLAKDDSRIKRVRTSKAKTKGSTRLVLDLNDKYRISIFALAPAGQYGDRLVVDLYDQQHKSPVKEKPVDKRRDVLIAIDAGHGGEDPGSIGAKGSYEKRVTLAIAKKLQQLINAEKGMKAIMTRSGDYYVDLDKRTEFARRRQVDFLVSVHADAFSSPQPSGASVWVVSDRRVENELARWLINREKNSELLGGGGGVIKHTEDDNLAFMLADMNKDHSLEVSISTANKVVRQLRKITKMHKKVPQHASFAVLKASDIPSILVETGFISNHSEEKNLNSVEHQQRLAQAIFKGIKAQFMDYPPKDTLFAATGYQQHRVARGESLSELAQRYNVSVHKIKTINNLTSSTVRIGQTLKIPRAE